MYELKFDKKAINFLNKLEKKDKERIWNKLQECKIEPFRYLKHLENMEDVEKTIKILNVVKIGSRKNIYN